MNRCGAAGMYLRHLTEGNRIMSVIVVEFLTLDGVVEDPDGFGSLPVGGWAFRDGPERLAEGSQHAAGMPQVEQVHGRGVVAFDQWDLQLAHEAPRASYLGIIYAATCVIVMPLLARAKRRASVRVRSNALHADSHQSDICGWLSAILLAGLALNALFGWWWADPIAALAMLPIIIKEGISGLRGEVCSHHHA